MMRNNYYYYLGKSVMTALLLIGTMAAVVFPLRAAAETTYYQAEPYEYDTVGYMERRPSAEAMIFDGLVVRPVALVGSVLGSAVYLATLPFNVFSGNTQEAARKLINEPVDYTFRRCFGCIGPRYPDSWQELR